MSLIYSGKLWLIQKFVSGFSNNAYLVSCKQTNTSIIIDTPENPSELIRAARTKNISGIYITHGHQDHLAGFADVYREFPVPVGIGKKDSQSIPLTPESILSVTDDTTKQFGSIVIRSISTPGHTPGSTCFLLPAESPGSQPQLFSGDTLFPGGPGKSSSHKTFLQLLKSITGKLHNLPDLTKVLPGHGAFTTIKESKEEYEYFKNKPMSENTYGDIVWKK